MGNKTIKVGDREYEVENKAQEIMLYKWNKACQVMQEVIDKNPITEHTVTTEKTDCYFYVENEYGTWNAYPSFCSHPDYKDIPLGEPLPCDNCSYHISNSEVFGLMVDVSRTKPFDQKTQSMEITMKGYGTVEPEKIKADNKGEHIITLATKGPNKMIYVGFSQHDDEAWYKCPVCNQQYGSWGFINGSVKVSDDGTFKCKCGTILVKPK